jgi:hypothetical protein
VEFACTQHASGYASLPGRMARLDDAALINAL